MVTRRTRADARDNGASRVRPVYYPSSDGKPMAETDLHRDEIMRCIETLSAAFADDADVYVSGNILLYFEHGNPRRSVSPDVLVVKGVPKLPLRDTYLLWQEGRPPNLVIEVTSRSTRSEDLRRKWQVYARLGVREYFLYDPRGDYLTPALQGHRLLDGAYVPIVSDEAGALASDELDMLIRLEQGRIHFYDRGTGRRLLSPSEKVLAAEEQIAQLQTRVAELEALLGGGNPSA